MAKKKKIVYDVSLRRENSNKMLNDLRTGKAGIFGIGNQKVKDQIDHIYTSERPYLNDALARWNVDESQINMVEPIIITVIEGITHRDKKDGYIRGSKYSTDMIAFSDKQIFVYSKEWHALDYSYKVVCHEFYYEDIVSVGIVEKNQHEATETKKFFGSRIEVKPIRYVRLVFKLSGWDFSTSYFDTNLVPLQTIQGAINLIRQKKA